MGTTMMTTTETQISPVVPVPPYTSLISPLDMCVYSSPPQWPS
jgi:hypothetical protein